MQRELNSKEQNLYDELISFINDCLEDGSYTIQCLVDLIDNLVDELTKTNEEDLWW